MAVKKKSVPIVARIPGAVEREPFWLADGRLVTLGATARLTHDLTTGTSSESPVAAQFATARDGTQLCAERGTSWVLRPDGTRVSLELLDASDRARALALSPDGRLAMGATLEGAVCWDAVTGAALGAPATGRSPISAAFDASSTLAVLVAGRHGNDVVRFGPLRSLHFEVPGTKGRFVRPAISPSGARVAFVDDKAIYIGDVVTGRAVRTLKGTQLSWSLAWIDERTLVSAARASIVLWDVESASVRATLDVRATELAFDPESSRLACATSRVWVLPKHAPETVILDARMLT